MKLNCLAYADDLIVLATSPETLQENIRRLDSTCEIFGMKISRPKTKIMMIGKKARKFQCEIQGDKLEQVTEFSYLGCVFSQDGKWDKKFESRKAKACVVSRSLRQTVYEEEG